MSATTAQPGKATLILFRLCVIAQMVEDLLVSIPLTVCLAVTGAQYLHLAQTTVDTYDSLLWFIVLAVALSLTKYLIKRYRRLRSNQPDRRSAAALAAIVISSAVSIWLVITSLPFIWDWCQYPFSLI